MAPSSFFRQFDILMQKNWILSKRNLRATVIQLSVPVIFMLAIFALQYALKDNAVYGPATTVVRKGAENVVTPLSRAICYSQPCYSFAYVPAGDWAVDTIAKQIADAAGLASSDYRGFSSSSASDDYLYNNPNTTQGVLQFSVIHESEDDPTSAVVDISYVLQFNQTTLYRRGVSIDPWFVYLLPLQVAAEKQILSFLDRCGSLAQSACSAASASPLDFTITRVGFPHPELTAASAVALYGPVFIFGAIMFNFVIQLGQIVREKELKLREGMRQMGLRDSAYWITWFLTNVTWNTLTGLILIASGAILQFSFFLKNDFPLYFFLFFLFGMAMVSFAFFFAAFLGKSDTASSVGFIVFLVGLIIQQISSSIYTTTTDDYIRILFSLMPFALLGKGLSDLGTMSAKESDSGMRWSQRFDATVVTSDNVLSMHELYLWLILDSVLYLLLGLYFDNVIPGEYGVSRHPLYFLSPYYWGFLKKKRTIRKESSTTGSDIPPPTEEVDADVLAEEQLLRDGKEPPHTAVKLLNLRKTFYKKVLGFRDASADFHAVKGSWLMIEEGKLFCLLGHNGAGKTTTFNMLTGLFAPTSGDAVIFGNSIIDDMEKIRKVMGVCPQHDILWNELTGREHLMVYAGFKGVPKNKVNAEVEERLKDVELTDSGNKSAGAYSGGMRRRLSVAIALIGNPAIVFLDEPTTGMDPVSRRKVWDLIENVKRDRVMVLTTHSMEEADILSDRIGIMKSGRISVVGTSLHLKNKFGTGYRMSLLFSKQEQSAGIKKYVLDALPDTIIQSELPQVVTFKIPRTCTDQLPDFFLHFEEAKGALGVTDVQLSLTTLEEVFMAITKGEDDEGKPTEEVLRSQRDSSRSLLYVLFGILLFPLCCVPGCLYRKSKSRRARILCWLGPLMGVIYCVMILLVVGVALMAGRTGKSTAVLVLAPARPGEPSTYAPDGAAPTDPIGTAFQWGAQVGDMSCALGVTSCTALLSARSTEAAPRLYVLRGGVLQTSASSLSANDNTLWTSVYSDVTPTSSNALNDVSNPGTQYTWVITGLNADTVYNAYICGASGCTASRSPVVRIRTLLTSSSTLRKVTFGATSGIGPAFLGTSTIGTSMASAKFDAILLAGDLAYQPNAINESSFRTTWGTYLSTPNVRTMLGSAPVLATWHDREYQQIYDGNYTTPLDPARGQNAYKTLLEAFPMNLTASRVPDDPSSPGNFIDRPLYRRISYGSYADVFILDDRTERGPSKPCTLSRLACSLDSTQCNQSNLVCGFMEYQLISGEQLEWLQLGLADSQAKGVRFKLIVSGSPITSLTSLGFESVGWDVSPAQKYSLLSKILLSPTPVKGVIFVSGGTQLAMVANVTTTTESFALQQALPLLGQVQSTFASKNIILKGFPTAAEVPAMLTALQTRINSSRAFYLPEIVVGPFTDYVNYRVQVSAIPARFGAVLDLRSYTQLELDTSACYATVTVLEETGKQQWQQTLFIERGMVLEDKPCTPATTGTNDGSGPPPAPP
mmetsp:Transcript_34256/g.55413  ORF Transcript_34256/g.55413 Transcript_34256/m.55413 type:complete len:1506 (+) Transcript_34256:171-4688(+)|eukprot:CAMPEP_0184645662 /NCGR_PEP_ID=MMETSP0308-20130426/2177_1 /TAXON_ID=38269 /ORGANISM="Gloeochaete witrockiana, Strain SAG 46.84" /LENGTH=1505 /DNA_ID=CAMNT_0027074881 /DNA_START=141 /DNA_END=4658 /DNA_ORIENTATION=+